jgi:ATP-dependent Clp protease protease subunit
MTTEAKHEPLMSGPQGEAGDSLRQRLLDQRVLLLSGPLTDEVATELVGGMLLLGSADPGAEIRLYINSPGGSAGAFLTVYDTMGSLAAPVATVCMSQAKETAALLLAAGAPGKKLAFRNALVLIKFPEERLEGFDNVEAQVEEVRRRKRSLIEIGVRHTGAAEERLATDLDRGELLTAEEAKDYGVIDAVIDPGHPYFVRFPLPPQPSGNGG